MRRLLIMACGATKRPDPGPLPATDRYDGPPFRTLRATLRARDPADHPTILILSARFGLIRGDTPIPAYDLRLTPPRALALRTQARQALAEALATGGATDTFITLGRS